MSSVANVKLVNDLQISHQEATQKLIPFTRQIRGPENDLSGKYSLKAKDLSGLFDTRVWIEQGNKGGHRKLINRVTHVVVEYANHGVKGNVDPGAATTILEAVQTHLNILCNDIFCYKSKHWKTLPDYEASAVRFLAKK